ncbi:MAG: hypothetical protein ACYTXC_25650 [Nostoc sp.]
METNFMLQAIALVLSKQNKGIKITNYKLRITNYFNAIAPRLILN